MDVDKYRTAKEIIPYYEISTTENFGSAEERDSPSNCEIPLILTEGSDDSEDSNNLLKNHSENTLICILDILEYEFLVKDLHIVYNFPHGMCDYINVSLPWHFNYPIKQAASLSDCRERNEENDETKFCEIDECIGERPSSGDYVSCGDRYCLWNEVCKDELAEDNPDTTDTDERDDPNEWPSCTKPGFDEGKCVRGTPAPCGTNSCRIGLDDDGVSALSCPHDLKGAGLSNNPQCCFGGSNPKDSGKPFVPDKACYGGPAVVAKAPHDTGLSFSQVTKVEDGGFNQTITLPDLLEINSGLKVNDIAKSTPIANYIEDLDVPPDDAELDRSSLPVFLHRCERCPHIEPRLFFEFECFDQAGETLHLIQLMIREWNTVEEFKDFYDDGGNDDADPDVEGTEGEDCDYETFTRLGSRPSQCNDLLDFADVEDCDSNLYGALFCNQFQDGYPRTLYFEPATPEDLDDDSDNDDDSENPTPPATTPTP